MDKFMEIIHALPDWIVAITALVTAASGITVLTPTKTDDKILNSILKVLHILSINKAALVDKKKD